MKFQELLRLREVDGGGVIEEKILRKLELPVPDVVFEQLIRDHAATDFIQGIYGELDLHRVRWDEVPMPASGIVAAAVHPSGQHCVDVVDNQAAKVVEEGWDNVSIGKHSAGLWQSQRTWLTPPLFVEGALVNSSVSMQLVEGHQRLGTMRGLVRCGWLSKSSIHRVWIGREQQPPYPEGPWKDVVRAHPVPFASWLISHAHRRDERGKIGVEVLSAVARRKLKTRDPESVFEFAQANVVLVGMLDELRELEVEWRAYTNP